MRSRIFVAVLLTLTAAAAAAQTLDWNADPVAQSRLLFAQQKPPAAKPAGAVTLHADRLYAFPVDDRPTVTYDQFRKGLVSLTIKETYIKDGKVWVSAVICDKTIESFTNDIDGIPSWDGCNVRQFDFYRQITVDAAASALNAGGVKVASLNKLAQYQSESAYKIAWEPGFTLELDIEENSRAVVFLTRR